MIILTAVAGRSAAADPSLAGLDEFDLPPPPSPWFREFDVRTGLGYKDNVSLASVAPVGSGFLSTGVEAFASRLPVDPTSVDIFLLFDDLHYFRSEPVDVERLGFVQLTVKRDLSELWQMSAGVDYLYQDQVLDVSTTEALLKTVQVEGSGLGFHPGMRLQVTPRIYLSTDWGVTRQFLRAPLDDYGEAGPRLTLGLTYGHRSELTLSFESLDRRYENYEELTAEGLPVPGTERAFRQQDLKLSVRHYYDAARHWRSTFRFGFRSNDDNGSGYFDYTRLGGSHQLMYRAAGWELRADAGYAYYRYDVQRSAGPTSPKRNRRELLLSLRAEKELAKFVKAFGEYKYEKTASNEKFFDYAVNTVSAGLIWIF